jgi:hypothetical protein
MNKTSVCCVATYNSHENFFALVRRCFDDSAIKAFKLDIVKATNRRGVKKEHEEI